MYSSGLIDNLCSPPIINCVLKIIAKLKLFEKLLIKKKRIKKNVLIDQIDTEEQCTAGRVDKPNSISWEKHCNQSKYHKYDHCNK